MVSDPPACVCLKEYVFNQWSRSAAVASCSLSGPSLRGSGINRNVFPLFFHSTFVMITRFVTQLGVFDATNCFPSRPSLIEDKCVCCEQTETTDDVLDNLFLYFVTCSKRKRSTFTIFVSKCCVIVTRLALYCVCDDENFYKLQDCLVLEQCSWHRGILVGTPCRRLLEIILPSICSCSEAQEFTASVTSLEKVSFLRRQSTDLVVLELGDQYQSFELAAV